MNPIFEILNQSRLANQIALDNVGRMPYPSLAVVTQNKDDQNKRRIKVAFPSSPNLESDWIRRLDIAPGVDANLPPIGSTVIVFFVDGLESNGYYLPIINDTNPPKDKQDIANDYYSTIPGNRTVEVGGDDSLKVESSMNIEAGGDINTTTPDSVNFDSSKGFNVTSERDIMMNCLNALVLQAASYLRLQAGPSNYIELGANGLSKMSGNWTINMGGGNLNFTNVGNFTINGKKIVVTGGVDTDGDTITNPGW
ncbi:phage baseplate assembly protein V [Nostoc sp. UHCC 0252]|uniref:phage baseplate assembly protein V n=1 Tax=Nostoc sp. UHCC 0252 TaxID=3110241 RepID=UPI002B21DA56|nr:phage baseplate assembly protein V [Nostoc sp. UHCC 0252]MEA5603716.1 phage baseplate assembly protein V [Nostoc sp. UHCC 0252]